MKFCIEKLLFTSLFVFFCHSSIAFGGGNTFRIYLFDLPGGDTIEYVVSIDSLASNGFDSLDVIDTITKSSLDLKGENLVIRSQLPLTSCALLKKEAQPMDGGGWKTFWLKAKFDSTHFNPPPPLPPYNFILSFDSADIFNFFPQPNPFVISQITIKSNEVWFNGGIDLDEEWVFLRNSLNNWFPSLNQNISVWSHVGPGGCDGFVNMTLELLFARPSSLSGNILPSSITIADRGNEWVLKNSGNQIFELNLFSTMGKNLGKFQLEGQKSIQISKTALPPQMIIFYWVSDSGKFYSTKHLNRFF
jgi:hypothetical protein